jgi:hypothetical protein
MPTNENLKKNMKVTLGGEVWKVTGFDNISVKGVSYVTLEETLKDTIDDAEIANYGELHNWTVTTSKGDNFTLASGEKIKLLFFYKNEEKMPNFMINAPKIVKNEVEVSSAFEIEKLDDNFIQISTNDTNYPINTHLIIHIEGWEGKDYLSVPFSIVKPEDVKTSTISGAKEFYVGDTVVLTVNGANDEDFRTLALENNTATIIEKDSAARTIKLKGLSIGKNRLYSANGIFSYPFEVLSIWLGGK